MSLWNPLSPENIHNPYPMYEQLRAESPIYKAQTGEWIFTKYEDVKYILTNRSFGSGNRKNWIDRGVEYLAQKDIDLAYIAEAMNNFILQLDPPAHTRIRRFVTENWDKNGVEKIIEKNTKILINQIKTGEFDIVESFAAKLPSMTTARIMGLPMADHQYLHDLSSEMIKALDLYVDLKELVRLNDASKKFIEYFREKINDHNLDDGLLKHLLAINKKATEPLNEKELTSVFIFLFVASEETSVSFLGTTLFNVIHHGLQPTLINKSTLKTKIEEFLRYDSPVQLLGRIASEDAVIGNTKIKQGDTLTLCIGAANRDPEAFVNPNEIQLDRNPKHLTFGKGTHYCLGDWLAKSVAEIAIKEVLVSFKNLQIVSPPANWYNNIAIRGFRSLRVSAS
ncbi:cytochrome P450 [Fulvivirga lutimaris]|uniref:cytochrome P450 n=1 Tax=Fulvivirga lutimaris TaxID=1819566 RepID=UPI0012BB5752|nr:cytochrome P450 [Fulvivirga lutimaris]MTI38067.1 cytochrome P450 [Fulvivirga lutimaris]